MKRLLTASVFIAMACPAFASEPPLSPPKGVDGVPLTWIPVMAAVRKDLEDNGVDIRCHTLGLLPNQTVTYAGKQHDDVFLVATGYIEEYYHAYGQNVPFTKYKCRSLYRYYVDRNGKIISREVRKQ